MKLVYCIYDMLYDIDRLHNDILCIVYYTIFRQYIALIAA